jgi:hypothetical protein
LRINIEVFFSPAHSSVFRLLAPSSTFAANDHEPLTGHPGWYDAGLIVTSWLQGTSREGDPQDHVHNQLARITRTFRDGKWRALDTMSVRAVLGALQAIAATAVESELTREFGVAWIPRADGRGNEIKGISQAQMDAYWPSIRPGPGTTCSSSSPSSCLQKPGR